MTDLLGKILLNRFRIDSLIAAGNKGSIYRVYDMDSNVTVVMKTLRRELAQDPLMHKRIEREARALVKLRHPNIVPFYGLYWDRYFVFLIEDYMNGPTLKEIIKQNENVPLSLDVTMIFIKSLCAALGYAHKNGVIHCDVQPSHILTDSGGKICLTDFGISHGLEDRSELNTGPVYLVYSAFEKIFGNPVAPSTDVYSLGVISAEMLAGGDLLNNSEFKDGQLGSIGLKNLYMEKLRSSLYSLYPSFANDLILVVLKSLQEKPKDRFQTTEDFYQAILKATSRSHQSIPDRLSDLVINAKHGVDSSQKSEPVLKVFFCYASQDKPAVNELALRFISEGWIDVWQDEKSLLPGQDWRLNIEEAVETSDIIIICLSNNSVSKEGHVQKELRYAKEIALEKPEETIFLIPIRFDECEVPRGLRFYQWANYFGDKKNDTYNALLQSLKLRHSQKPKMNKV